MRGDKRSEITHTLKRCLDLRDLLKKSISLAFAIATGIFTFVPESFFEQFSFVESSIFSEGTWLETNAFILNIIIGRLTVLLLAFTFATVLCVLRNACRRKVLIKGNNYIIEVKYGNLLNQKKCKRVIGFDECYTTKVGEAPEDIKPSSICGQYLLGHPNLSMPELIGKVNLLPSDNKSRYKGKECYESGLLVPNGDDLLLAFAKLDEEGRGQFFTREEYLRCLDRLWKEIEKYYGQKDVCIPILGSGLTRIDGASGASYSQQEMLDMIIGSYWLNSRKIKAPCKLRIVCKKVDGFSLNKIARLQ